VINSSADARSDGSMANRIISLRSIPSKITKICWDHNLYPSVHVRTSMLSNLILEDTVTADNLAEDEINCENFKSSGLRQRRVAVSAADDDMMGVVVVVIVKVVEQFQCWRHKRPEF
jgi:hypothetical protein